MPLILKPFYLKRKFKKFAFGSITLIVLFYILYKYAFAKQRTVYTLTFLGPRGYANKMYNVLTCIIIGIVTDSDIFIHLNYMDIYVDTPFKMSKNMVTSLNGIKVEPKQSWIQNKTIDLLINTTVTQNSSDLAIEDWSAYFFEVCSNPIYHDKLVENGLVEYTTIKEAQDAIKNEKLNYLFRLEKILRVGYEAGSSVLSKYWKLKPTVTSFVDFYLKKYFYDNFVIGIHIRSEHTEERDLKLFQNCAIKLEYLFGLKSKKPIKWFIATDMNNLFNDYKEKYNDKVFTSLGTPVHVGYDFNHFGLLKALIDIELLSKCDEFISSGGSTFGFIAGMRTKKLSYYINGQRNATDCYKMNLSLPSIAPWFDAAAF